MTGAVVVGTGFGARVHVPALRAAGFDVIALVGRDEEKTARRARHRYTHLELGPYTRLCEAFRARIESRTLESPVRVPTFADGVASVHVLDAVRRSASEHGELVRVEGAS